MPEAHAIDITKCIECPYCGTPSPEQKRAPCQHPLRLVFETSVELEDVPPKMCPIRTKLTVLRIVMVH